MTDATSNDQAFAAFNNEDTTQKTDPRIDEVLKENQELKSRLDRFTQAVTGEESPWQGKDKSGRPAPTGWDEVDKRIEEAQKRAAELARKEVLTEVEKREQARLEEEKKQRESEKLKQDEVKKQFDQDWFDLVEEGKMPKMSEETEKKWRAGELTEAEALKDPALVARLNLIQTAREKGETSLYKAYHKHFTRESARRAPVMGAGAASPIEPQERDYEDIHKQALGLVR